MGSYLSSYLDGAVDAIGRLRDQESCFDMAASVILGTIKRDGAVFFAGNGGSASDAQHLAAELVGRFKKNRPPLRAVCLNTDTSVLTALANDFGYDSVFARQLVGLSKPGDTVILISTSGESASILKACEQAQQHGVKTIALTGSPTSSLASTAEVAIAVGTLETCHIQEAHITIGQALCGFIEHQLFG